MSFIQFNLLPQELQTKIWKLAIPGPQLVQIWWTDEFLPTPGLGIRVVGQPDPPPPERPAQYPRAPRQPVPAILHICHESREIGLKHYQLTLPPAGDEHRGKRNGKFSQYVPLSDETRARGGPSVISIDFHSVTALYTDIERDVMYIQNNAWASAFISLGASYMLPVIHEPILSQLRYLAVVHHPRSDDWVRSRDSPSHVTRMTHMGRDLRGLRGLLNLRCLVLIVPKEMGWDLGVVKSICEDEVAWAWDFKPQILKPGVRVVDDMWAFRGLVESGELDDES